MVLQRCFNFRIAILGASTFLRARLMRMILMAILCGADVCTFVTRATRLCLVTCRNAVTEANTLPIWCCTCTTFQCKWKLARVPLRSLVSFSLFLLPTLPSLVCIPFVVLVPCTLLLSVGLRDLSLCTCCAGSM